jgi:hypothetical protein
MYFVASTYSLLGSKRKFVTCRGCGQQYDYIARREGYASIIRAFPFIYIGKLAKTWAFERARKQLNAKLERAVNSVFCPHCGILQANMRGKRYEKEKTISLFVGMVVFLIGLIAVASFGGR